MTDIEFLNSCFLRRAETNRPPGPHKSCKFQEIRPVIKRDSTHFVAVCAAAENLGMQVLTRSLAARAAIALDDDNTEIRQASKSAA